jgi:hypothetical protein
VHGRLPCFRLLIQQRLACCNFAAALAWDGFDGQNLADMLFGMLVFAQLCPAPSELVEL